MAFAGLESKANQYKGPLITATPRKLLENELQENQKSGKKKRTMEHAEIRIMNKLSEHSIISDCIKHLELGINDNLTIYIYIRILYAAHFVVGILRNSLSSCYKSISLSSKVYKSIFTLKKCTH